MLSKYDSYYCQSHSLPSHLGDKLLGKFMGGVYIGLTEVGRHPIK